MVLHYSLKHILQLRDGVIGRCNLSLLSNTPFEHVGLMRLFSYCVAADTMWRKPLVNGVGGFGGVFYIQSIGKQDGFKGVMHARSSVPKTLILNSTALMHISLTALSRHFLEPRILLTFELPLDKHDFRVFPNEHSPKFAILVVYFHYGGLMAMLY